MDEKKKKKFGLSLKNSKKVLAEGSLPRDRGLNAKASTVSFVRQAKSNDRSNVIVIDKPDAIRSSFDESRVKFDYLENVNTKRQETWGSGSKARACHAEDEISLWKNLFPMNYSVSWEKVDDLPTSVSTTYNNVLSQDECHTSEVMDDNISRPVNVDSRREISEKKKNSMTKFSVKSETVQTEEFNINLDYIDLPKSCTGCYTRKPVPLSYTFSAQESDICDNKRTVEKSVFPSIQKEKFDSESHLKSSLINNTDNKKIQNWPSDCEVTQIIPSIGGVKRKWITGFENDKNKLISKNNSHNNSQEKRLKTNSEWQFTNTTGKTFQGNDIVHLKSLPSDTHTDLTTDTAEQRFSHFSKMKIEKGTSLASVNPTRKKLSPSLGRTTEPKNISSKTPWKPLDYTHNGLNVKKDRLVNQQNNTGEGKDILQKEVLHSCPMCQLTFPTQTSKQEVDQHITICIGDEVIIDDDEEDDW